MKHILAILAAIVAVNLNAQVVTLDNGVVASSATSVVNNEPQNMALLAQQVARLVDELKPSVKTNDASEQDARIHELERMVLAVNAKLAASTNGVTAQAVKEAVIAAAPPQYKDLLATIAEVLTSLLVLCRYLYAWKNGASHKDAAKAVFCGTNAPTAPRQPVNTP